jgi:putative FmdB family regulatory protein
VPTYGYRCTTCGGFDVVRAMSGRADREPCPSCGLPAARVFDAPALRMLAPGLRSALTAQERSAHDPAVVTTVPAPPGHPASRRRTPVTTDPRHLSLPRP